jgi:hypothetical protein
MYRVVGRDDEGETRSTHLLYNADPMVGGASEDSEDRFGIDLGHPG